MQTEIYEVAQNMKNISVSFSSTPYSQGRDKIHEAFDLCSRGVCI